MFTKMQRGKKKDFKPYNSNGERAELSVPTRPSKPFGEEGKVIAKKIDDFTYLSYLWIRTIMDLFV